MGQDCIDQVIKLAGFPSVPSRTSELPLHGHSRSVETFASPLHLAVYGADRVRIDELAASDKELGAPLDRRLPYTKAEVVWAVREEMARTVEDVLARRTRALLLDSTAAVDAAPAVAKILAKELGRDAVWQQNQVEAFRGVARFYQLKPKSN
jgi:glycerol-3-phosphate dehydrogenase